MLPTRSGIEFVGMKVDRQRSWETSVEIQIPFHDVDAMGIVWHGNYVKYFEVARCALLDSIDYNYGRMVESGYAWPVVNLRVRYPQPARFEQRIVVTAAIKEFEHRLRIAYLITDAVSGRRMTRGSTVQVAVDMATNEVCFASPRILLDKLGVTR
jgi:acyl-CoA thioester hydrolase